MNQFLVGILVGSALTATVGFAGTFYDSQGRPAAPRGSIESFDYFRSRQLFLDQAATRRAAEELARSNRLYPCGR